MVAVSEVNDLAMNDLDAEAVCAARDGDPSAFEAIVERYSGPLYTLALRTLGDREDAEDAVQEIFLKAYASLHRFDCSRRLYPWLYTIGLNYLRSLRRRISGPRRAEPLPVSEELLPAADGPSPEETALRNETRNLVTRALDTLTGPQRRVFTLRHLQGLSTSETARLLSMPENTVKTHLRRARERLAAELAGSETE